MPSSHSPHSNLEQPRRPPPAAVDLAADPGLPLDAIGPIDEADRILVLGGPGSELMCALLHAGAAHVTHLRAHERPEADSASLVIVPRVPSLDWLATAMASIRRAMTEHGRVVLLAGPRSATQAGIRRILILHGLTAIQSETCSRGGRVFTARITFSKAPYHA